MNELHQARRALNNIFQTFRGSSRSDLLQLQSLARSNASLDEISAHVERTLARTKADPKQLQGFKVSEQDAEASEEERESRLLASQDNNNFAKGVQSPDCLSSSPTSSPTSTTSIEMEFLRTYQPMTFFSNLSISGAIRTNGHSRFVQERQIRNLKAPAHLSQPLAESDNSPLSGAYLSYQDAARQMIANGTPIAQIIGPDYVVVDLMFRDRGPNDPYSVSCWASELCKTFEVNVFAALAHVSMLTHLLRWLISPTVESYVRVPALMRPTDSQRLVPHHAGLDMLALPCFRDTLVHSFREFVLIPSCMSCSWPYSITEACETDLETGSTKLTPLFEDHVTKQENWSYHRSILEAFPELEGHVTLSD